MYIGAMRALLAVGALWSAAAQADFQAALRDYQAGHYDSAHRQFMALAELGDCASQFNLGAMALQGQGGPADRGSGVGWLQVAAANGCEKLAGAKLPALQAGLSGEQSRAAADIVARYGHEALRRQGIVDPDFSCRDLSAPTVIERPTPDYRHLAHTPDQPAIVITALTIGTDGHARDPEILLAAPEAGLAGVVVEAWLNSLFTPAVRNGQSTQSRLQAKLLLGVKSGGTLASADVFTHARPAADAGDAAAAYLVGLTASVDPSLGIPYPHAAELLIGAARDGNAQAQYWVGNQLRVTLPCHPQANGTVWLQHAAEGGSAAAQLALAGDLLSGAPAAEQLTRARALLELAAASDSFYVRKHVAALLAASPLDAVRDPPTALSVAKQLSGGDIQCDPQMFEVVAAAYAAAGDFRTASAEQQTAIQKARDLGWNTHAMADRLAAYRHGTSWHGDLLALAPLEARSRS